MEGSSRTGQLLYPLWEEELGEEKVCLFNILPDEIQIKIFYENFTSLAELAPLFLVSKRWNLLAHDSSIGRRLVGKLMELNLVQRVPANLEKESWSLIQEVVDSECEIYLDVSGSMMDEEQAIFSLSAQQTTLIRAFELTDSVRTVKLFPFSDEVFEHIDLSRRSDIEAAAKLAFSRYERKRTEIKFIIHLLENQIQATNNGKMKSAFIISDLTFQSKNIKKFSSFIKNNAQALKQLVNFNLIFEEVNVSECSIEFKGKIHALTTAYSLTFMKVINESPLQKVEEAKEESPPKKKRRHQV